MEGYLLYFTLFCFILFPV